MTCNHSASEIRAAFDEDKPFVGCYAYDSTNLTDEENGIATIIMWSADLNNKFFKYVVNEDKTVEEFSNSFRLIPGEPICISVDSYNTASPGTKRIKEIIKNNKNELVPFIYLFKDDYVYSLVFYQIDDAGTNDFFRFACVTDTAIKFGEISGDSNIVTFTDKSI